MTFPSEVASPTTGQTVLGTSHVITIPAGSTGDLLLAFVSWRETTHNYPLTFTGWTSLGRVAMGSAPDGFGEVWYRVATGSDPVTATMPSGSQLLYEVRRLTDYSGVPVAVTSANGSVGLTTYDPPNLTSGFGAVDSRYYAWFFYGTISRTIIGTPSGYTAGTTVSGLSKAMVAYKDVTSASEDPGQFALSSDSWQSGGTVAISGRTSLDANFSGDRTVGDVPTNVVFTDLSAGGVGTINSWTWDFGDGTTSTSQNPNHTYSIAGIYTVSLAVGTTAAETDTETKVAYIRIGNVYIPPPPGNAVIEIYAAAPGSARWGVAQWGVGVWSSAQWVDVTPQSVDATVRWGSHSPQDGILVQTEPASWLVDTYDPDRVLDPGNPSTPYAADLRAGLPIRIRHRDTVVRQGICETIAFYHKHSAGGIRVTDNVSLLARTKVPSDITFSDTLRQRARDVIAAAGLSITVEPDPPSGDPALAPQLDNERSVWRHIADAAEQTMNIPYVDRIGTLKFRPWASPYDRGRFVDATQLVDLGTIVQTSGLYSVVRAQQTVGDGGLLIERRATPVPQWGPVVYERTDVTIDADAWADAVLTDRSLGGVQWIPGDIYPLTANDVEYFATLEAIERFGVSDAFASPTVDITGIIVGGEFTVNSKKDSEAVWSFVVELAQTADSPLLDDDTGAFLLSSAGDEYLYPDT